MDKYYGINIGMEVYDYDRLADIGMLSDEYPDYQRKSLYAQLSNSYYYYDNYDFEEDQEEDDDFLF